MVVGSRRSGSVDSWIQGQEILRRRENPCAVEGGQWTVLKELERGAA